MEHGEIVIYKTIDNTSLQIEVRVEDETVWLSQAQLVELFSSTKQNISLHINNIFKEGELEADSTVKEYLTVQVEGIRKVRRKIVLYNLDVIISVGYRVKSIRATQFRVWANKVLKEYLLKGYAMNHRIENIENDVYSLKKRVNEFDFQLKTHLPPSEGIFYDGQIFDAYKFVIDIVQSATKSIVLIDNYIDQSVLMLLAKRSAGVDVEIFTTEMSEHLKHDLKKLNAQYPKVVVKTFTKSHDRFIIIDKKTVYHIGASLKDLGKKWFAFSKMNLNPQEIIDKLKL